ncbi:hypothetical protein J3E68DRAFT_392434 [Trichoderma sp. SZMC 28012]
MMNHGLSYKVSWYLISTSCLSKFVLACADHVRVVDDRYFFRLASKRPCCSPLSPPSFVLRPISQLSEYPEASLLS